MKKILLSILGFCLLASFTINKEHSGNIHSVIVENMVFECPQCKEEFKKCTKAINDAVLKECSAACDKFKEGKITREAFEKICNDASDKNKDQDMACMTTFNKCCLKETKELMDKEEQNKESIN